MPEPSAPLALPVPRLDRPVGRYAVQDALPAGWTVQHPSWHIKDDDWHVFAVDHPAGQKWRDYIEAVGMDQAHCMRGLAELLRVWRVERVAINSKGTKKAAGQE